MGEWTGAPQALVERFADDATLVPTLRGWRIICRQGWRSGHHCCTLVCCSCFWATAAIGGGGGAAAAATAAGILGATTEARHGGAEAQNPLLRKPADCQGFTDEPWALLPTTEMPGGPRCSGQAHGQVSTWKCLYPALGVVQPPPPPSPRGRGEGRGGELRSALGTAAAAAVRSAPAAHRAGSGAGVAAGPRRGGGGACSTCPSSPSPRPKLKNNKKQLITPERSAALRAKGSACGARTQQAARMAGRGLGGLERGARRCVWRGKALPLFFLS